MRYLYYPGCSPTTSNKAYDLSARAVGRALGVELVELDDWNCCGATAYMSVRELSSFVISSRNLALAERQGGGDLVTVCSACLTVLNKASRYMAENEDLRRAVSEALAVVGLQYSGGIRARHLLDVLVHDVGLESIAEKAVNRLGGLRVAPYYGCQVSRPYGTFDDREFPVSMDRLFSHLGAEVVDFPLKAKCCGGMLVSTNEGIALRLIRDLFACAVENGAQVIATVCPLCHINLEAYQGKINKRFKANYSLPIVYFTQLVGAALGLSRRELGLGMELVPTERVLAGYKLAEP
ncbi:MAG: CoB--CoM heterodisulfide reductase iron-sulfur subunit B family protein [Chloroflexi bacterium]|nr:CoB--CoM heterodisulfide reductase iron-sulfur subunit B family protein [Chloroflexota bacterium]